MASLILAIKFYDDSIFKYNIYAKIAGISPNELKRLERKMLKLLHYNLWVEFDDYIKYIKEIKDNDKFIQE